MVYETDPRAGYCQCDFNLTWYLEYLSERNTKLVNLGETDEDIKRNEIGLYNEIDVWVNRWVTYKVFDYKHPALDDLVITKFVYCDIYQVVDHVVHKFCKRNPDMWKVCDVDEEEDTTCDVCERTVKPKEALHLHCLGDEAQTVVMACDKCQSK